MAAFNPTFSITQSTDALKGTVTDLSNYADNDEGIVVGDFSERTVTILDAFGEEFATVTFDGEELTAEFDIGNINLWADAAMAWAGISPVSNYEKELIFPLARLAENQYQLVLQNGCCQDGPAERALSEADRYFRGAEIAAPSGNASLWQSCVDAASSYLRSVI